uniref:Odorant receptor n=1 Tax=Conopomorpha sinensis TaxID=940481 RepID=A0A3Q8HDT9_9NEOP|nr:putative odorant receptor 21 [Conopomorpha sinensis]
MKAPTEARSKGVLDKSSGHYETVFFEPVYRVFGWAGLAISPKGFLENLYSIFIKTMIVTFVMSELWYLFSQTSNLDKIIDNINVTLIHLIAMYRYMNWLSNRSIYKRLAGAMEEPTFDISTPERKKLLHFWVNRSLVYLKLLLGLGSCTLAAWYVYPLVDDVEYNLTVAVRLPFDYATPKLYVPTYLAVLLAFNYTSYFVMVNDLMMQTHLMHLLCQYDVLGNCFENILADSGCEGAKRSLCFKFTPKHQKRYLDRLRVLVHQHKFIVKNTQELRDILSIPMLCQFMASSLLICFAGYQVTATIRISTTKFLMSLLYLSYNMFQLFIFCRWCDEIKIQSANIAQAIYSSSWECGALRIPGVRRRLMLVLLRASKPLVLTAGGLYDLSLASYSTLVKTSYSALTVLLRVRDD